jgi:crossover junction endonuclease MUS81
MQLNIDYREKALLQRISVEPKNLTLGDITIEKDGKELLIIERKTISDLASSICDGRYKEQSFRLMEHPAPNHNIMYIIEGSLDAACSLNKKTLLSSLISLWYNKGFSIFRTENVDETAEFVKTLFEKLQKDDEKPHIEGDYTSTLKKQKRDKINEENIHVIMLSQIPGISATIASAVMGQYKTIFQLEKALQENSACLDTFVCGKRKISKPCIEKIKLFFCIKV